MSTNQTKNLKLHSWAPLDRFTREEFNDNWAGIDAAWGDLDGRVLAEVEAHSATAAALATETAERKAADTTLQKNIDAKAAASSLTTETSERKAADTTETNARVAADNALGSRVSTLETQIKTKAVVTLGSYKGNGASGTNSSQDINLGFRPKAVFVRATEDEYSGNHFMRCGFTVSGYATKYGGYTDLAITDTGFTAYNVSSMNLQLNRNDLTYVYVALS